jgi:uncharacterized protein YjlB
VATLRDRLAAEGWPASAWSNGPGDRYAAHEHGYDKMLVVEVGSIAFGIPGGTTSMAVGDRLELPARTSHTAVVGPDGVTCLEAHAPAGKLDEVRVRRAGDW